MDTNPVSPITSKIPLRVIEPREVINTYTKEDLDRLEKKINLYNPDLSREETRAIPIKWYTDPEIFKLISQAVFGWKNWIGVGRTDKAPIPLTYFQLKVGDVPVAVLRDADGTLNSFHNICSHRGFDVLPKQGKLKLDEHGDMKCGYHGWRYKTTGKISHAPKLGKLNESIRDGLNLRQFEIDTWGPLSFVRMEPSDVPLSTLLAPLIEKTANIDTSSMKWKARVEYIVKCNPLVFLDNYLDAYHIEDTHPGLANVVDLPNYRTDTFVYSSIQHSPTKNVNDPNASVRTGGAMYWWIYPNVMINIYPGTIENGVMKKGVMDTNLIFPIDVDKCKVIFDYYFTNDWDMPSIKKYIEGANKIQLEDIDRCEKVQGNLRSFYYSSGPYAMPETGTHHFHKLLAKQLKSFISERKLF